MRHLSTILIVILTWNTCRAFPSRDTSPVGLFNPLPTPLGRQQGVDVPFARAILPSALHRSEVPVRFA
jgi:hypothetical protein